MVVSPAIQQWLVIGACLLAALSTGCAQGYPMVLLLQLSEDDSPIKLSMDAASWIGSIHGLAGLLTIFITIFMQWRGRKFAFRVGCIVVLTGWVIAYTARSVAWILISEVFHGVAMTAVSTISILTLSEMTSPEFRNVAVQSSSIVHGLGVGLTGILARFLDWRTACILLAIPAIIALLATLLWPESPPWLACKGRFDECVTAFRQLRSMTTSANKELEELIAAQKENLSAEKEKQEWTLAFIWYNLKKREFFMPLAHMILLINLAYWSGIAFFVINNLGIMKNTTNNNEAIFTGGIMTNVALLLGLITSNILSKWFNNKTIILWCTAGGIICLVGLIIATVLRDIGILSKNSYVGVIFHVAYIALTSPAFLSVVFTVCSELIPVRHRGLGGAMYVISNSVLYSLSLKLSPYLFLYIKVWGTFLLFCINAIICVFFVWKYVPETKNKTLQQIEDFYTFGKFVDTRLKDNEMKPFVCVI